jgi:hypothetical protein
LGSSSDISNTEIQRKIVCGKIVSGGEFWFKRILIRNWPRICHKFEFFMRFLRNFAIF